MPASLNGAIAWVKPVRAPTPLGGDVAHDVEVIFIPDAGLGTTRLLGMSIFERFALTIDHEGHRLLLKPQ